MNRRDWKMLLLFVVLGSTVLYGQEGAAQQLSPAAAAAKHHRDSVRAVELQRQGIDKNKEDKLRALIGNFEKRDHKDPRYFTMMGEVVARGVVVDEGSGYVDIRPLKLFKSHRVIWDEDLKLSGGEVMRSYDADRVYVMPLNFKRQSHEPLPARNEEVYVFLDRRSKSIREDGRETYDFNTLAVFPVFRETVSAQAPDGQFKAMPVGEFESEIQAIMSVIGGGK